MDLTVMLPILILGSEFMKEMYDSDKSANKYIVIYIYILG